jgi:hypothetical protein
MGLVKAKNRPKSVKTRTIKKTQTSKILYPKKTALGYKRGGMSDGVTKRIQSTYKPRGLRSESSIHMEFQRANPKKAIGMKKLKISRNHILSDYGIARIVAQVKKAFKPSDVMQTKALKNFTKALTNSADILFYGNDLNQVAGSLSNGKNNLRFDHAGPNSKIQYGFDPEVVGGRETQRSLTIRTAVWGLRRARLISDETLTRSIQPTIEKGKFARSLTSSSDNGVHKYFDHDIPTSKKWSLSNNLGAKYSES